MGYAMGISITLKAQDATGLGMSGFELLSAVRPPASRVRLIAMSGAYSLNSVPLE